LYCKRYLNEILAKASDVESLRVDEIVKPLMEDMDELLEVLPNAIRVILKVVTDQVSIQDPHQLPVYTLFLKPWILTSLFSRLGLPLDDSCLFTDHFKIWLLHYSQNLTSFSQCPSQNKNKFMKSEFKSGLLSWGDLLCTVSVLCELLESINKQVESGYKQLNITKTTVNQDFKLISAALGFKQYENYNFF
jgi:hypothetical protein